MPVRRDLHAEVDTRASDRDQSPTAGSATQSCPEKRAAVQIFFQSLFDALKNILSVELFVQFCISCHEILFVNII